METVQTQVQKVAEAGFGCGQVGYGYELPNGAAETAYGRALAANTLPLTVFNTADCGDGRFLLALADGTNDPVVLRRRVAPQLFGGEGLAATKAVVAANAAMVQGAKTMQEAYEKTIKTLEGLGEEDAAHEDCGASGSVESSVASPIDSPLLVASARLILPAHIATEGRAEKIAAAKQRRLQDGFYGTWDKAWHADLVQTKYPQNFSYLNVDHDHALHGHHETGLYVLSGQGVGFARNQFVEQTGGQEAFATTVAKMAELSYKLGGSDEERADIFFAFVDDALHVGAGLMRKDMPIFADQAADSSTLQTENFGVRLGY